MTTKTDIRSACESFFLDWHRGDWMQAHGEWASQEWDDERTAHAEAKAALEQALQDALEAVQACSNRDEMPDVFDEINEARETLDAATKALDGQVRPDESDYIAEGRIDPDDVADEAESLDVGASSQGWDCTEGWSAYRVGTALYVQWWRDAYGNRHDRDLWVQVDGEFFEEKENEAA